MASHDGSQGSEFFQAVTGLTVVKSSLNLSHVFIVQQYLRMLLQRGCVVILVAAEQSFERYQYASKKTGLNLLSYRQSGHLAVLEAPLARLDEQSGHLDEQPRPKPGLQGEPARGESSCSSSGNSARGSDEASTGCSVLQQLYGAIRGAVEKQQQQLASSAGVAVILDSLTALASLRCNKSDWAAFLHYCCCGPAAAAATTTAPSGPRQIQVPYCVIAGVYEDVPDDRAWLASLEHRANLVVDVESLPGRIADVDGMVTLTRRYATPEATCGPAPAATGLQPGAWNSASPQPWRRSLYFKSSELSVRWMERVTARELL